ncbi:MAG TPA: hypothetical protein VGW39_09415 [Chthoniobacterales bacterium]|nr:hypothetical protein [Chthoniobacterales bacterium]
MNARKFPHSWKVLGSLILGLVVYFSLSASWPLSAQSAQTSPRLPKIEFKKPEPATITPKKKNNTFAPESSNVPAPDESRLTNAVLLLKEENRRLRLEIERLRAENAQLRAAQQ